MRYRLTACRPDNTTPVYKSGASTTIEVVRLIDTMRRFSGNLNITICDTETGIVETKRAA